MNKRRKLLLALSGASATTVWTRPVVDAVMLPVHAETTETILPTDPTPAPTPTPEPTPEPAPTPEPTGVVQWQLMDVGFVDTSGGGAASGSFTYDYTSATITDWNIAISGGNIDNFPERSYTMTNSTFTSSSTSLRFTASDEGNRRILLAPVLSSTAPTDNLSIDLLDHPNSDSFMNNFEVSGINLRGIGSGSLEGTVVV